MCECTCVYVCVSPCECTAVIFSFTFPSHFLLFISSLQGTPIQNNIPELFSLLNFMHREEFRDKEEFLRKYGTISTEDQVQDLQDILRKSMEIVIYSMLLSFLFLFMLLLVFLLLLELL